MAHQLQVRAGACTILTLLLFGLPVARADWPMARQNPARTGSTAGVADLAEKPSVFWRADLGGGLSGSALVTLDVNADGKSDVVVVTGGRLRASSNDGVLVWESARLGLRQIVAVADLDGDGTPDLVGATADQVIVFKASTGEVEWDEPLGEMGTLGVVRVGDLDGDGRADLVIKECGCCATASGNPGFVYSFGGGFTKPKLLWTLPGGTCGDLSSTTLLDMDGDGKLEYLDGSVNGFYVLEGATGKSIATTGSVGSDLQWARCRPVKDSKGIERALCINGQPGAKPSGRSVFLLTLAAGKLTVSWERSVGDVDAALVSAAGLVQDLDGDGKAEVVVSGKDTAGIESTYILDLESGALLATIAKARAGGVVPTSGKGLILTTADNVTTGWSFDRSKSPAMTLQFNATAKRAVTVGGESAARCGLGDRLHVAKDALLMFSGNPATGLEFIDTKGGVSAAFAAPPTARVVAAWQSVAGEVVVSTDDGVIKIFDETFGARSSAIKGSSYFASGGWRALGSSPTTAKLGTGADSILMVDGRGSLLRLDAKDAGLAAPPAVAWSLARTSAPVVTKQPDGSARIVALRTNALTTPPTTSLVAIDSAGVGVWSTVIDGDVLQDVVAADLDGDGFLDPILQWGRPSDLLVETTAYSGKTGSKLWTGPTNDPGFGRQTAGLSVLDWNGDGTPDIAFQGAGTQILSGKTGGKLASGGPLDAYFMVTPVDVDKDGKTELLYHGGFTSVQLWKQDLTTKTWSDGPGEQPFPYGAVASCTAQGLVAATGSWKSPGRMRMLDLGGSNAGKARDLILADGKSFPNETAAAAVKAVPRQLSSITVHANPFGTGEPGAFAGSADGWLYAVDPCKGELRWSLDLGAAVGEPVFGDTDGDGRDELVVSVADGSLYGIHTAPLPAPKFVLELEGPGGTVDVDVIGRLDTVELAWGPVDKAARYEAMVVEVTGKPLTGWRDVGTGTTGTLTGLSLTSGTKYVTAVRALTSTGAKGPDAVSDGFTPIVLGDAGVDGGGDGGDGGVGDSTVSEASTDGGNSIEGAGCGCRVGRQSGQRGQSFALLALVVLGGAARPRRRKD